MCWIHAPEMGFLESRHYGPAPTLLHPGKQTWLGLLAESASTAVPLKWEKSERPGKNALYLFLMCPYIWV